MLARHAQTSFSAKKWEIITQRPIFGRVAAQNARRKAIQLASGRPAFAF